MRLQPARAACLPAWLPLVARVRARLAFVCVCVYVRVFAS